MALDRQKVFVPPPSTSATPFAASGAGCPTAALQRGLLRPSKIRLQSSQSATAPVCENQAQAALCSLSSWVGYFLCHVSMRKSATVLAEWIARLAILRSILV